MTDTSPLTERLFAQLMRHNYAADPTNPWLPDVQRALAAGPEVIIADDVLRQYMELNPEDKRSFIKGLDPSYKSAWIEARWPADLPVRQPLPGSGFGVLISVWEGGRGGDLRELWEAFPGAAPRINVRWALHMFYFLGVRDDDPMVLYDAASIAWLDAQGDSALVVDGRESLTYYATGQASAARVLMESACPEAALLALQLKNSGAPLPVFPTPSVDVLRDSPAARAEFSANWGVQV